MSKEYFPDEPYWECKSCGAIFLDSFKDDLICDDPTRPAHYACPLVFWPGPTKTDTKERMSDATFVAIILAVCAVGLALAFVTGYWDVRLIIEALRLAK